jgi:hypothetical protein
MAQDERRLAYAAKWEVAFRGASGFPDFRPPLWRYECRVPPEAVSYLCRRLVGQRVTAEQAVKTIEPVAERFELPYAYGDFNAAKPLWRGHNVSIQ